MQPFIQTAFIHISCVIMKLSPSTKNKAIKEEMDTRLVCLNSPIVNFQVLKAKWGTMIVSGQNNTDKGLLGGESFVLQL